MRQRRKLQVDAAASQHCYMQYFISVQHFIRRGTFRNDHDLMNSSSFLSIAFRFCVIVSVSLATIWLSLDRMVAEKVATALVLPAGILWLLLLFSCAYAVAARQRVAAAWLMICWLAYSVAGSGFVSDWLATSLEQPYLSINPLEEQPFEFVVVLGGGGGLGANQRLQGNGSGDRMILAAQLYHQGLARKLICTGQRIESMNSTGIDPAEVSLGILTRLGVPVDAIEKLGGRNTSEEMKSLGERFGQSEQRIGLLTSAWHLPRALRLARRNGFHPQALPADFRSSPKLNPPTSGELIVGMIPGGDALSANGAFCKEFLGMLVGR